MRLIVAAEEMVTELILVRHGQSTGNVARDRALAEGLDTIEIAERDADVPLTGHGLEQARAVGRWLKTLEAEPSWAVIASPYVRAVQTAETACGEGGIASAIQVDERLRDRELGILDLLTQHGIERRFPEEAARRRWLGKLYYRPPGGESWADVALRLRSFLGDLAVSAPGASRAIIVSHDAVIMLLRYVCERWDEATLLETAARTEVANASVTRLVIDPSTPGLWMAESFNAVEHLTAS